MLPLEKQTTEPGLRDNGFVLGDSYKKSLANPSSFGSSSAVIDIQRHFLWAGVACISQITREHSLLIFP
jgi:hypothetical protein